MTATFYFLLFISYLHKNLCHELIHEMEHLRESNNWQRHFQSCCSQSVNLVTDFLLVTVTPCCI